MKIVNFSKKEKKRVVVNGRNKVFYLSDIKRWNGLELEGFLTFVFPS